MNNLENTNADVCELLFSCIQIYKHAYAVPAIPSDDDDEDINIYVNVFIEKERV